MSTRNHQHSNGFTLIEIMVAMVIGLFLFGGVFQLFTGMTTSSRLNDQSGYLQENGRMGIELMSRYIRNADYWGCIDDENIGSVIKTTPSPPYDPDLHGGPLANGGKGGVSGTEGDGYDNGKSVSDSVSFKGFDADNMYPVLKDNANSANLQLDSKAKGKLQKDQIVLVSNCKGGDVFQITNLSDNGAKVTVVHNTGSGTPGNTNTYTKDGVNGKNLNCTNCLSQQYADGNATIGTIAKTTLSIRLGTSGDPVLYMVNSSDCAGGCELIEGVENMQILYGEDTNGDFSVDRYVKANEVGLVMENVIAIEASLLIRSQKKVATDEQKVAYNGTEYTFNDGYLRKVYTATTTIRNRTI